jgi:hypothetical protein
VSSRYLLGGILEAGGIIGSGEGVRVAQVRLDLPRPELRLDGFEPGECPSRPGEVVEQLAMPIGVLERIAFQPSLVRPAVLIQEIELQLHADERFDPDPDPAAARRAFAARRIVLGCHPSGLPS